MTFADKVWPAPVTGNQLDTKGLRSWPERFPLCTNVAVGFQNDVTLRAQKKNKKPTKKGSTFILPECGQQPLTNTFKPKQMEQIRQDSVHQYKI